jgi:hypothetical protein
MEIQTAAAGSNARRRRPSSPSELLVLLHQRYPHSSRDDNQLRFIERALEDEEILKQTLKDWYALHYNRLLGLTRKRAKTTPISTEERKAATATIKSRMLRIALLEMVMPHGKTLGDTTGKELRRLAPKIAGMNASIIEAVAPRQKVRDVLTEDQLRGFFSARR